MTLSVRKLLLNHYPASLAWMFISMLWVIFPFFERRRLLDESGVVAFLITVTVLLSAVLVWRIHRASRLFQSGRVAPARITGAWVSLKGPITFDFAFDYEGHRVRARMHVVGWTRKPVFKLRQTVDVLYDPMHPTRAIIRQLFQA